MRRVVIQQRADGDAIFTPGVRLEVQRKNGLFRPSPTLLSGCSARRTASRLNSSVKILVRAIFCSPSIIMPSDVSGEVGQAHFSNRFVILASKMQESMSRHARNVICCGEHACSGICRTCTLCSW